MEDLIMRAAILVLEHGATEDYFEDMIIALQFRKFFAFPNSRLGVK